LIEILVGLAILATLSALAIPALSRTAENRRLRDASVGLSGALSVARSEAIRSGHNFIVFFQKDSQGALLKDSSNNTVPILILDDGRPGDANQNCQIDAGEPIQTVAEAADVTPGVVTGTTRAPNDLNTGTISTGSSFRDPTGNAASWVMFRPEGVPVSFGTACDVGPVGSGAGAFYMNNGDRTTAVVLMPMGATRIHSWKERWSD